MKHPPTPQQAAYYAIGTDPYAGSIALDAKAGCGKTSSQAGLASRLPGTGLATSVLRNTIADLAAVMPSNWETKGLHALGFAGIRRKLRSAKVDTKGNALYEFCKEALKDEDAWWKLGCIRWTGLGMVSETWLRGSGNEHSFGGRRCAFPPYFA